MDTCVSQTVFLNTIFLVVPADVHVVQCYACGISTGHLLLAACAVLGMCCPADVGTPAGLWCRQYTYATSIRAIALICEFFWCTLFFKKKKNVCCWRRSSSSNWRAAWDRGSAPTSISSKPKVYSDRTLQHSLQMLAVLHYHSDFLILWFYLIWDISFLIFFVIFFLTTMFVVGSILNFFDGVLLFNFLHISWCKIFFMLPFFWNLRIRRSYLLWSRVTCHSTKKEIRRVVWWFVVSQFSLKVSINLRCDSAATLHLNAPAKIKPKMQLSIGVIVAGLFFDFMQTLRWWRVVGNWPMRDVLHSIIAPLSFGIRKISQALSISSIWIRCKRDLSCPCYVLCSPQCVWAIVENSLYF